MGIGGPRCGTGGKPRGAKGAGIKTTRNPSFSRSSFQSYPDSPPALIDPHTQAPPHRRGVFVLPPHHLDS